MAEKEKKIMETPAGKTIKAKRYAVVDLSICVACGACADVCPREAISIWKGSYSVVDDERCVGCGRCAKECPATAIRIEARS